MDKHWLKTVFPVSLSHWPYAERAAATHFSSIMQWRSYQEVTYKGVNYGNKDKEFPKFIDLPQLTNQPFRIALTGDQSLSEKIINHGWEVIPGWSATFMPDLYHEFIQNSHAEFSVAKHGYVQMRGGWFSDRSICYLASGRPILIQDTGQGDWLPLGEGVLTFRDLPEALVGIEAINVDYEQHRHAARRLAEEYFDSNKVLSSLLEAAMN